MLQLDSEEWGDLPQYGTPEFVDYLDGMGMTLAQFKQLPVYKAAVKRGLIKE